MSCYLVAGLGFGDECKGATVDCLVSHHDIKLIVRYNGGAQCAHNVVTPKGIHHTFRQFGSGSFRPGVKTYLSNYVLVNPVQMLVEARVLEGKGVSEIFSRTYADERALIVTPFHIALNRLIEMYRGDKRHGSTGVGIGTTRELHLIFGDKCLFVKDLKDRKLTEDKLRYLKGVCASRIPYISDCPTSPEFQCELDKLAGDKVPLNWYVDRYEEWNGKINIVKDSSYFDRVDSMIFEGAQGMLLDETFGFQPHVTWTDITFKNANNILKEMGYKGSVHKIGALRSYFTRHGDGPFPSEDSFLKEVLSGMEKHNASETYTGDFRIGNFDMPLVLYALRSIGGVDSFAISHMDIAKMLGTIGVRVSKMDTIQIKADNLIPMLSEMASIPVSIVGSGPTREDRDVNL